MDLPTIGDPILVSKDCGNTWDLRIVSVYDGNDNSLKVKDDGNFWYWGEAHTWMWKPPEVMVF